MNEMEKKIIIAALEILYNINNAINLLDSIGVKVDGNIKDDDLGCDLYESANSAYKIIEEIMQGTEADYTKIAEIAETLYAINEDSKETKINECLAALMRLKNIEGINPLEIVDEEKFNSTCK